MRRILIALGLAVLLVIPISETGSAAATTINVSTASQLTSALANAVPGQTIVMADGPYAGRFKANKPGAASQPIVLRGSSKAIINGGDTSSGYALQLDNADYWQLSGFSVMGANKAIMVDSTNFATLTGLDIGNTGQEAIHFRKFSTDNTLQNSTIHDAGLVTADYGEGIYVGSAKSNWSSVTGGQPDKTDRNKILNNTVRRTKAESIDVKEATSSGVISGNTFDGTGITGANFSDSLIDMKGNNWLVSNNSWIGSSTALKDVIQTHVVVDGWGKNNTFELNRMQVAVPGYGINISGATNIVKCNNTQTGAAKGLSNVACTR